MLSSTSDPGPTSKATTAHASSAAPAPASRIGTALPWDTVHVLDLIVRNRIGVDSWQRARAQPLRINLVVYTDIDAEGAVDAIDGSSYTPMIAQVTELAESRPFKYMETLAVEIAHVLLATFGGDKGMRQVAVTVEKLNAHLHTEATGVHIVRTEADLLTTAATAAPDGTHEDRLFIRNMSLSGIIGLNPWERDEKQPMIVNLDMVPSTRIAAPTSSLPRTSSDFYIANLVQDYVEQSAFKTIEALCHHVARLVLEKCDMYRVSVKIEKPAAVVFAKSTAVQVTRDQVWLAGMRAQELRNAAALAPFVPSFPAEGVNVAYVVLASRAGPDAIRRALKLLQDRYEFAVADTSFMYATKDPALSVRVACKLHTSLSPLDFHDELCAVERELTENDSVLPATLDLVLFNDMELSSSHLVIPPPHLAECEDLLRPLADIAADIEHPTQVRTIGKLLSLLMHTQSATLHRVLPILHDRAWLLRTRTYTIGILDLEYGANLDSLLKQANAVVADGADMIELADVDLDHLPCVVERLRGSISVPLAVRTSSVTVARAVIDAGADMIVNDATPASRDLFALCAEHSVPVVTTADQVNAGLAAGIWRWNLLVVGETGVTGFPRVVAPVPRGHERSGDAAVMIAASIAAGADILCVHDVAAVRDAVRAADRVWRGQSASVGQKEVQVEKVVKLDEVCEVGMWQ
ncbi:trifunctional dihydropteroate synthetase [Allomyces arbusculus]|nr:trifunctional dihydropteroate synthetase [Allomyces arbusculus]